MSAFTGDLTITQLGGRDWRLWRLEEHLVYQRSDDAFHVVMVSKGFITDGPSIPRFLWAILPVWATWSRAGIIHDYLCCLIAMGHPHREALDRNAADKIFREAMQACGVGLVLRNLLYLGVRVGTWCGVRPSMVDVNEKLRGIIDAAADGI